MWWEWTIFAIVLVIVLFGVNGLKKLAFSEITPTKEQERYARKKAVLYKMAICVEDLIENKYEAELNGIVENKTLYIRGNKKLQLMGA